VGEVEVELLPRGALEGGLSPLVIVEDNFFRLPSKVVSQDLAQKHVSAHESPSIIRKAIPICAFLLLGVQKADPVIESCMHRTETAPNPDLPGGYLGIDWSQRCDPRC
jgi:hypothetical protein